MSRDLTPRGRIVDSTIVGVDPVTMLKGPIPVTRKLLERTKLSIEIVALMRGKRSSLSSSRAFRSVPLDVKPNVRFGLSRTSKASMNSRKRLMM